MYAIESINRSLTRQVNHWFMAATRLSVIENLASANAWQGIDHAMETLLKESFRQSIEEVLAFATALKNQLENGAEQENMRSVKRGLLQLRDKYLKAEETIQFYTVAINSRTTPRLAALLRACDILCIKSMQELLEPLGRKAPLVLTYVDKGVGASILKAGLKLWDGRISPVAAIKVTQHNLYRPTAIIHETGHQVAHMLNWNEELAQALQTKLVDYGDDVSSAFSSWSSEMAADAFAFVHTGFAAVAALSDVVSGTPGAVFAYHAHDPHPISYLRVLMNVTMCREFYGSGPWDDLAEAFQNDYDLDLVSHSSIPLIRKCVAALPDVVRILLKMNYRAFDGKALAEIINPNRAGPLELNKLEYLAGPALFTSHAWIWKESLRLLALNGYKIGLGTGDLQSLYKQQEDWMIKLGFAIELN
ncbi:hypothetical protein [Dyadobacter sp. LHD-138]|uniref:hypothetical protein n=1 Tax=Dyadobacter sp. LHD-138 TaxID=3071413 RepID=UPI0027DED1D2|nr:hypothetical protein [Dyadobacter sp. LHD-138]MDQ6477269.1 hypothetical protein [Dyadobacter sp. LHD-138]